MVATAIEAVPDEMPVLVPVEMVAYVSPAVEAAGDSWEEPAMAMRQGGSGSHWQDKDSSGQ